MFFYSAMGSKRQFIDFADQTLQYPFFYRPQTTNNSIVQIEDGWTAFAPVSEWSILLATHADEWRISYLNRDYKICNSYPSAVIVPRQIDDQIIISSAGFRDGGRFPVLCYRHEGGVSNELYCRYMLQGLDSCNIYSSRWFIEHTLEKQSTFMQCYR